MMFDTEIDFLKIASKITVNAIIKIGLTNGLISDALYTPTTC